MKKKFSVRKTKSGILVIKHNGKEEFFHNALYSLFKELQTGSYITIEFEIQGAKSWYHNVYVDGDSTRRYKTLKEVEKARLPYALATIKTTIIGDEVTIEKVWSKVK